MNQELGQHRFAMSHQSNNGLNWQIDNQFHNKTYNEIYNEINHQINHPMNHQINHQIHNEIHNEMNQVNQLDQNAVNEQTMNQPTYESTLNQHSNYFADNFIPTGWELDVYNSEIDDTESVQSDELNKYFFTNRFINEDDFEEDTNWIVDRNGIQTSNEEIDGLNMDLANLDDTYLSADELANQSNSINRTTNDQRPNDDKLTGLELVPYVSDDEIGKNDECSTGCIKNEIDYDCSYLKENFFVSDADQMDNERDDVLESYKNEFQMNFPKLFKNKKKKSKKVSCVCAIYQPSLIAKHLCDTCSICSNCFFHL